MHYFIFVQISLYTLINQKLQQRLYYEDEKTDNFEQILIKINEKCSNKLIQIKDGKEIIEFILSAIKSAESNSLQSCM